MDAQAMRAFGHSSPTTPRISASRSSVLRARQHIAALPKGDQFLKRTDGAPDQEGRVHAINRGAGQARTDWKALLAEVFEKTYEVGNARIPSSSIRKSSTKSRKSKWISAPFSKAVLGREPTMTIDVPPLGGSPTSAIFPIVPTPYEAESVQGNPQSSRKQRTGFVSEYGAKWADRRRRNGGKRCLKPFAFLFVVRPFGEICSALFQGKYLTLDLYHSSMTSREE